jgi:hypothetical protein
MSGEVLEALGVAAPWEIALSLVLIVGSTVLASAAPRPA